MKELNIKSTHLKKMQIGIDNYSLYPLEFNSLQILQWAKDNGAEGVSFSGLPQSESESIDDAYLKDLAQFAATNDLYAEWGGAQHIPRDMTNWSKKEILKINEKAAREAQCLGTRIVRSCSGGLMRWSSKSPATETLLLEMANALKAEKQMLIDHNVILAIETHFEFTTWELLRIFDMCETGPGEYLGICLDTMNLLTMLEHPVAATERVLPWIVSTHIKDGALYVNSQGMQSFPTEIGKGIIELDKIVKLLHTLSHDIHLSIEDHGGYFSLPIFDPVFISKFPDLTAVELASLISLAQQTKFKLDASECEILDREKWPEICQDRIKRDIRALNQIQNHVLE
ncbi:sugar phosphate isomerase/epimerase [candidate division KSB1 bacterium]|nr:sugar phosphate isomerase/epimerase [candidate division KSB1 bacterium]